MASMSTHVVTGQSIWYWTDQCTLFVYNKSRVSRIAFILDRKPFVQWFCKSESSDVSLGVENLIFYILKVKDYFHSFLTNSVFARKRVLSIQIYEFITLASRHDGADIIKAFKVLNNLENIDSKSLFSKIICNTHEEQQLKVQHQYMTENRWVLFHIGL